MIDCHRHEDALSEEQQVFILDKPVDHLPITPILSWFELRKPAKLCSTNRANLYYVAQPRGEDVS
jgi:hypothetical protein